MTANERGRRNNLLSFAVANERYAVEAVLVHSVVRPAEITRLPGAARHMIGFINLRSAIIPVASLRRLFSLPDIPFDRETRVVVIEHGGRQQGLLVDSVLDVLDGEEVEDITGVAMSVEVDVAFFRGFLRASGVTHTVVDVPPLLAAAFGD